MHKQILLCTALALTACGSSTPTPDPCPDCEGADDTTDGPIADLPCGGADLQNDDLNCGACGNECPVEYADGPYEAGNCNEGKCGPRWFAAYLGLASGYDAEPPEMTCEEVCAGFEAPCVERGCAGLTGYTCSSLWGWGCSLTDPDQYPKGFEGSCTEPLPWGGLDDGAELKQGCCCQPTL